MTRYAQKMTMRRPPWFVRLARHLRNPHGSWPLMDSKPWWHDWFAIIVPYQCRRAHQRYATTRHRFWLPCPLCGQPFGGHEWRNVAGLPSSVPDPTCPPATPDGPIMSVGICPRCTRAGKGVPGTP